MCPSLDFSSLVRFSVRYRRWFSSSSMEAFIPLPPCVSVVPLESAWSSKVELVEKGWILHCTKGFGSSVCLKKEWAELHWEGFNNRERKRQRRKEKGLTFLFSLWFYFDSERNRIGGNRYVIQCCFFWIGTVTTCHDPFMPWIREKGMKDWAARSFILQRDRECFWIQLPICG